MRVFVTGGSGFIGSRLVSTLIDAGHEVVCLSRSGEASKRLASLGAEVLSGDLTDATSLRGSVIEAKPTHVAHLAAEIATQRNRHRIDEVNVGGTRSLIEACRNVPLERFLFVSSVVRGEADGQTLTEEDVIPATTAYGRSKEMGDRMALKAHAEWGLPAVILRPSHVYGAGGWLQELLSSGMFRIPGTGDNYWDVVHVDDVVSAAMVLLERGQVGEAYHVVDDEPVTMKGFFQVISSAMGRKPFGHVPVWVAKVARGKDTIAAVVRSARSSNEKLKALGWTPTYPRCIDALPTVVSELGRGGEGSSDTELAEEEKAG